MTKILIVVAVFYENIAQQLLRGATCYLDELNIAYEVVRVPGAFEIPAAISFAITSTEYEYSAYIALGCVLRGETTHYEHVCHEVARGINDLAIQHVVPIGFGVITAENIYQAQERACIDENNFGTRAARAAIHMNELRKQFHA